MSLTVNWDSEQFLASLEPGLVTLIIKSFEDKLKEKMNTVIFEVYAEMEDELPEKIKTRIHSMYDLREREQKLHITVDWTNTSKE